MHRRERREARTKALITAHLRHSTSESEVHVVDVSPRGLQAMMPDPPPRGSFVELTIGRQSLVGQVKWSGPSRFGVALRDAVSVPALLSGENRSSAPGRGIASPVGSRGERKRQEIGDRPGGGRSLQFVLLIAALVLAAISLTRMAHDSLQPLAKAGRAMSGEGDIQPDK